MKPDFLTVAEVLALHEIQLHAYGGLDGLRDKGLLESAVAMPQATFGGEFLHLDLFAMAAAYAFHIAENQPFIDGNKRAGLHAALVFLDLNGFAVIDPEGQLYEAMLALSRREMNKDRLAKLLEELSYPR
jgi:death-on-curing protein